MRSAVMSVSGGRMARLLLLAAILLGGMLTLAVGDASASHFRGGNFNWVKVTVQLTQADGSVVTEDWGVLRMSIPVLRHDDGLGGGSDEGIDVAFSSTARTSSTGMLEWARKAIGDPKGNPVELRVEFVGHGGVRTFNLIDTFPLSFKAAGGKGSVRKWTLEVRVNRIDMA